MTSINGERGGHGLPNSRTTTFCCEAYAEYQRLRVDFRKIENHPARHALQQYLRQNQSFNLFNPESKKMSRDVGTPQLCEYLETELQTQCTVCLSYWNTGIPYCICGHLLHKERGANQKLINCTMDLLSVPEYVIKKGRPHGHRYGKKPGDREYYPVNQLKKKCNKFFQGIHDRFIRDLEVRDRMIENNRDEELCRTWDALAYPPFDPTRILFLQE